MSPPRLKIREATLGDLLSALRRHDAAEAGRLLALWSEDGDDFDFEVDDDREDWDDRHLDDPLTAWVHREAVAHVADGRFEHALCLVEQYRAPAEPELGTRQVRFSFSHGVAR